MSPRSLPCLVAAIGLHAPLTAQDAAAPAAASGTAGVEGYWTGALSILGTDLPFSVTFEMSDGVILATMDIPAQGAFDLPLTEVSYEDGRAHFELQAGIGLAVWDGAHAGDTIEGEFTQSGAAGTFSVERGMEGAEQPDEPEEPVPYREEEIFFENGDLHFEGTLTLPEGEGPFPAAVMITGSGAQNRDEELVEFPVFRVIADHLTRRGIAVYRYDDRGIGGSTGNVALSTTSDFADDVLSAVARLSEHEDVDLTRIGLIGHSEGGVVAPLAVTRSESVAFMVLLAGTSVSGAEIIYEQAALIARAEGADEDAIADQRRLQRRMFDALSKGEDLDRFREELAEAFREEIESATPEKREDIADIDAFVASRVQQQITQLETPWFRYFLVYDPATALRQTTVPVLGLFGELDLQVAPGQNRGPMAEALSGNRDVTIEVISGANHLFQAAETGSPSEYATLEKAFVDGFLQTISDWILVRFGN